MSGCGRNSGDGIKDIGGIMTEKEYLFMLGHVPGIGAITVFKLKEYFKSFEKIWKASERMLAESNILSLKRIQILCECRKSETKFRKEYESLEKNNIRYIAYFDDEYPMRLKPYRDRPTGLFVKGKLPDDKIPSVSVVGARNCTPYGRQISEYLACELSRNGVQIISGLALGIDSAAHRGALKGGGETFAVLGCGVNICYPRENFGLFSELEAAGGIVSELIPGTAPAAMNFPMRNRIISGLSDAVIIVEAREKSGSLITGDFALEQGKEVFAVPGRMNDPLSLGCNKLLQTGAAVCLGPQDVLEFLGIKHEKKLTVNKKTEKALAKRENLVYSFLDSRPKTLEEIVIFCQIPVSEVLECLMTLELSGLIQSEGNQYYCRKM